MNMQRERERERIIMIALSTNLGSRRWWLWERRERRRRMEESRETTRLRRDWSSEAALEMKDEAESWSSLACSTTLPTSSSSFFADSDSPISSLLFDFLLSFFFFNSLEILTTDSYCNSNWRLAERPRNRQLYKNTKYTQSQRQENEPKKKKEYAFATHSQSLTFFSFHALSPIRFVLSGCGKERFTSSSNWCWNWSLEVDTITHSSFSFLQVLYTLQTIKQTSLRRVKL